MKQGLDSAILPLKEPSEEPWNELMTSNRGHHGPRNHFAAVQSRCARVRYQKRHRRRTETA